MSNNLIRISDLQKKIGLSRSAIYLKISKKSPKYDTNFPQPVKFSNAKNSPVVWVEDEVDAWIDSFIQSKRKAA